MWDYKHHMELDYTIVFFFYALWKYAYTSISINAIQAMIGTSPKMVTVLLSQPVVFALKICVNAIGSKIAASSTTTKMLIIASPIAAIKKSLPYGTYYSTN